VKEFRTSQEVADNAQLSRQGLHKLLDTGKLPRPEVALSNGMLLWNREEYLQVLRSRGIID